MIINELFDKIAQWDYTETVNGQIKAEFAIDDNLYTVIFFELEREVMWSVEFVVGAFNDAGQWLSHNIEMTGTGNEFQVFATVLDIIKKATAEFDIQKLKFSADKYETNNRSKLYTRMVSVLAKGWDVQIGDGSHGTEYLLTKKGYQHD